MPTAREDESPKAPSPDLLDSWGGETDWNLIRSASGGAPGPDRERAWRRLVDRYRGPVKRECRHSILDLQGFTQFISVNMLAPFHPHILQPEAQPRRAG